MKKVIVNVEQGKKNFAAYIEVLPGCITTGKTLSEIEKNMREAIKAHVELTQAYNETVPKVFLGKYDLVFKYDPSTLLSQFTGIFTKAALERITGINQRQLWHYASGEKKPRTKQKERIEQGLHKLGKELLSITL
jgi:predicted RNase H-like HicB family nuclease